MNSFIRRPCYSAVIRSIVTVMIALTCSDLAFCGEIHDAAKAGDLENVKTLLAANPELVNAKNDKGDTPLMIASAFGHNNVVEFLLSNKADVNAKDNEGQTLLHLAAGHGRKNAVELLLVNGANINAKDNDGQTPLHLAVFGAYKDVAELLLAHQAEINTKNGKGYTPLAVAAAYDRKDVAKLLLANGADVNGKDNDGHTPLDWAVHKGNEDVAELIRQHVDQNTTTVSATTTKPAMTTDITIHEAARDGDLENVKALLKANPYLANSKDTKYGGTPLHWAAARGRMDVAEFLLANKADVNAKNYSGQTPLTLAVLSDHRKVADLLRQHGGLE